MRSGNLINAISSPKTKRNARKCCLGRLLCSFLWCKTEESRIFRRQKNPTTSLFDMPPCRDFVIFFMGESAGKSEQNSDLNSTYEEWSTPGWAINRSAARPWELRAASRWTSKELSLSQGALALTEHELLAAVVVRKKHLRFSRRVHPGDETNLFCLAQLAAAERPQRTRWRPRLYSAWYSPSPCY